MHMILRNFTMLFITVYFESFESCNYPTVVSSVTTIKYIKLQIFLQNHTTIF